MITAQTCNVITLLWRLIISSG